MADPTAANIYRVTGKLIKDPTGYNPATNHGGTVLGAFTSLWLDLGLRHEPIFFDELGKTGEVVTIYDEPLVRVALRSRDDDALSAVLPSHSSNITALGGDPVFLSAGNALKLLLAPDDPEAPGFVLYNAVPMAQTSELGVRFSVLREQNLYVTFLGLPTSAGNTATGRVAKLSNLFA